MIDGDEVNQGPWSEVDFIVDHGYKLRVRIVQNSPFYMELAVPSKSAINYTNITGIVKNVIN